MSASAFSAGPQFDSPVPISSTVIGVGQLGTFDVDLDGDLDMLVVDGSLLGIALLENIGNDRFDPAKSLGLPIGRPLAFGAIDIEFDGTEELLVLDEGSPSQAPTLVLFSRAMSGALEVASVFPLPLAFPASELRDQMKIQDVDGDGRLDAVFRTRLGMLVAYQDSPGQFFFLQPNVAPVQDFNASLGDLDGNGLLDLIAITGVNELGYYPQISPRVFGSPVPLGDASFGLIPTDAHVVDFDEDGDLDLIVAYASARKLQAYENLGGGLFQPEVNVDTGPTDYRELFLLDMDHDGDLDLLGVANVGASYATVGWIENLGAMSFEAREFAPPLIRPWFRSGHVADWNADGFPDVLLAGALAADRVSIETLQGQDPAAGPIAIQTEEVVWTDRISSPKDFAAVDLDGDGDLDLITAARLDVTNVTTNVGPGRMTGIEPLAGAPDQLRFLQPGDVDADGMEDVVASSGLGQLFLLRNHHDGTVSSTQLGFTSATANVRPCLIDLDGDGDLDVLAVAPNGLSLTWFENTGGGAFLGGQSLLAGTNVITEFACEDFSGDGIPDIAVARTFSSAQRVIVHLGLGGAAFGAGATLAVDVLALSSLIALDVDASGLNDLVWLSSQSRTLNVARAGGGGGFGAPVVVSQTTGKGLRVEPVPLPGGGHDLVVSVLRPVLGDRIEYYRWLGGLSFAAPEPITESVLKPIALLVADLDGDGDSDLVSGSEDEGRVDWYPGLAVPEIGERYCSGAVPNSTGRRGRIHANGSDVALSNELRLVALDFTPNAATLFLASTTQGEVLLAGGSQGTLCLGGAIGRFLQPGQAGRSNADGYRSIDLDLTSIPQPTGAVPVLAGQTWSFQAWHRDVLNGAATSNFTDAVAITFL